MSNIVTLEQAVRLKGIGFDREVVNFYDEGKTLCEESELIPEGKEYETLLDASDFIINQNKYGRRFSAPTVPEALDYLREEKGIACAVGLNVNSDDKYLDGYIYEFVKDNNDVEGCSGFDTYHLAELDLLDAVLDYLEKKGGEG